MVNDIKYLLENILKKVNLICENLGISTKDDPPDEPPGNPYKP